MLFSPIIAASAKLDKELSCASPCVLVCISFKWLSPSPPPPSPLSFFLALPRWGYGIFQNDQVSVT